MTADSRRVLLVEPFYGGSHMQFMDFVANLLRTNDVPYDMVTLPAKKWHWRARTSALNMRSLIPTHHNYHVIFCSSVLNLAELIALRPDLRTAFKIIYFHENQFIYPRQKERHRDFQYGYNNILSALVADKVIFNSQFNLRTFKENLSKHLRQQPDQRVTRLEDEIAVKSDVIYCPVSVKVPDVTRTYDKLHIVWPHRWEHDKDPETFFQTLIKLKENGATFLVSVLGQSNKDTMPIFDKAYNVLGDSIAHFGRVESREQYLKTLATAHVVVSTARHEFFGIAVAESVLCGCLPLLPTGLAYDELYPKEYIYRTPAQLYKRLMGFCKRPHLVAQRLTATPIDMSQLHVDGASRKLKTLLIREPRKK